MRLDAIPRELLVLVAAAATIYALVVSARRWTNLWRMRLRMARAAEGEREAVAILERHGYSVEGAQVTSSYVIEVDGAPVEIALRADYVVRRGPERYIAEVKTGRVAPRIETPATRRQLLEYLVAFGASGVLLVDAEAKRVRLVVFPMPKSARDSGAIFWLLAVAAIVLVVLVAR
ncbi:MAG TPA: hypothetical protein VM580_13585 [Labilithrix sp.]|nr:hypothetical protein [Labilithrix sp.]